MNIDELLTNFPPGDSRDEQSGSLAEGSAVTVRIRAACALEEAGVDVLALRADVSDESQMRMVVGLAIEKFGQIDGVIHGRGRRVCQSGHDSGGRC